jgi:hypothetical protein
MADIEISQSGDNIVAEAGGRRIAACAKDKTGGSKLFKLAVDAVPNGGSLSIGPGTYRLPTSFGFSTGFAITGGDDFTVLYRAL